MSSNGRAYQIVGRQLARARYGQSATPQQISECTHEAWEAKQLGDEVVVMGPVITTLSTVTPRPVDWLWKYRIPRGKTTLVYGDPGLGKSFLTGADFAARVSTGSPWPDGSPCECADVVLWTGEDDLGDTVVPRLMKHGADLSRIHALEGIRVPGANGKLIDRGFTLEDYKLLGDALALTTKPGLVVIDPVSACLGGKVDSHRNDQIRGLLTPLAKLAAEYAVSIVMVTHMSKGGGGRALYRAMGSLAFAAAARAAWLVVKDEANPSRRLFLPAKNNLGDDTTGFAYSIVDGAVTWEKDPVTTTADQALAAQGSDGTPGPVPEAMNAAREWLGDYLASGPVDVTTVESDAKKAGINKRTLRRAKEAMGVRSIRDQFAGHWMWRLKGTTEPLIETTAEPEPPF